ncbi:MAG: diguanylate cyclase [Candidatus Sulfotelmatobacter sp.]
MKILLVEDSSIDRHKVGGYLTDWGLDHVAVGSGTEAVKLLESAEPPTMALLDWLLPGLDGIDICRRIRKLGNGSYIYTVMLTSKNRKQDLLLAMEAGADDYLSKPVDPSELRARVMAGKRILELQQSLRFAATHDFLTGLLNRSEILAALQREFSRSGREGKSATVILADIDHFKRVNDSLGHAAGDEVLKEVARRMKCDLRPYDVVGRYGGEEFLIILPGCDLPNGVRRAEQIRNQIANEPVHTPSGPVSATVSMGVTVTTFSPDLTGADILQQADISLYKAKNNGRNRTEVFSTAAGHSSSR